MAKAYHERLSQMSPAELAKLFRHVAQANKTKMPLIRVQTHRVGEAGEKFHTSIVDPHEEVEDVLRRHGKHLHVQLSNNVISFRGLNGVAIANIDFKAKSSGGLNPHAALLKGIAKGAKKEQEPEEDYEDEKDEPPLKVKTKTKEEKEEEEFEPNDSYPGGDEWVTPAEKAVYRKEKPVAQVTAKASQKAVRKINLPPTKTTKPKSQIKAAVRDVVRQKAQQAKQPSQLVLQHPAMSAARERFDWSGVERAYTTTKASKEEIANHFGISPKELDAKRWAEGWKRPHGVA